MVEQRVALVTGAGRGIGRSHALVLAANDYIVVVNDIGLEAPGEPSVADEVVSEIMHAGGAASADRTDVGSIAGGMAAVVNVLRRYGRLDVLVNNAGVVGGRMPITAMTDSALDDVLDVHVRGAIGTMKAAIPAMSAAGYGRIVNTVSQAAWDPPANGGTYAAAKAALWALTLTAAKEVEGSGVTVNGLSPGARTRMSADHLGSRPASGLDLDPRHVAQALLAMVGCGAGHINGRIIHAAGGALREYETTRRRDTPVLLELSEAIKGSNA